MFWDNFIHYCNLNNVKPSNVTKAIGMNNSATTDWKKGAQPRDTALKKIADYFGVTVDDLKADSAPAPTPTLKPKTGIAFYLTAHEADILTAYRDQPEMRPAVDRILGVTEDNSVLVYEAAKSADNHPPQIVKRTKEEWNALKNAPETDEDLL